MDLKLHFTQTEHEPQVWGRLDHDWAAQVRAAWLRRGADAAPVVDDPEAADLILFCEPHQDSQVIWAPRLRAHPLVRRFPERTFIWSIEDSPLGFLPGLYCSLARRLFDPRRHRTWVYQRTPNPYVEEVTADEREREPRLLASFIGAYSHPLRTWLFEHRAELERAGFAIGQRARGRFNTDPTDPELEAERRHYIDTILDSKFSLCPRGNGVATFRLQESMALGRAPVVVSDQWVPIEGPDWDRSALFVAERDLPALPEILNEHAPRWREMGRAARETWERWFAGDRSVWNAVDQVIDLYRGRRHDEAELVAGWEELIASERRRRAAL